ncbi:hypothetical protein [Halomonas aquatica]|uniref:Uncharacterized protein n=1 Tax=Halomonas aquatica TaxID=3151123 RepID=A0ABV1NHK9_9GAMM
MAPTADRLIRTLDDARRLGVPWAGGPDARGHDGWHGGWFSDGVPVAMS